MKNPRGRGETGSSARPEPKKARIEYVNDLGDTRLFVHLMGTLIHRIDMDRRRLYESDLDRACVAGAVALQSADANLRLAEFRAKYRDLHQIIGLDAQTGINALSIAQYTGIPRETVRRKLKRLVEQGAVVEKSRGSYVIKPGFPQKPESIAVIQGAMRYTLQFMNDCLAMGLIKVVDR
ncbi:MAG TPA: HTH domain-containing protein [Reyranella sp.]|nr:HTH domain-containing protein [Reyranella sp.]